ELVKDEIQRMSKLEKELYDAFTMVAEMQSGGHTTMSNVIKSMI
ncbi:MAG: hypothetical protein KDJ99_07370, partial [Candidatus Competibacteraceae bacterium]|nr:hypothetical protein [Candidatus Competibacteraceae bacterium]